MSALTNGRYSVPVPMLYIDEPDLAPRERRPNRRAIPVRMMRKVRDWR